MSSKQLEATAVAIFVVYQGYRSGSWHFNSGCFNRALSAHLAIPQLSALSTAEQPIVQALVHSLLHYTTVHCADLA